ETRLGRHHRQTCELYLSTRREIEIVAQAKSRVSSGICCWRIYGASKFTPALGRTPSRIFRSRSPDLCWTYWRGLHQCGPRRDVSPPETSRAKNVTLR